MKETRIMLLSQLVNSLSENFQKFERAYSSADKEGFNSSEKNIIEIQNKIEYLLKNP